MESLSFLSFINKNLIINNKIDGVTLFVRILDSLKIKHFPE